MKDKKTPDSTTTAKSGLNQNKSKSEPVQREHTHDLRLSQTAPDTGSQCDEPTSDAQQGGAGTGAQQASGEGATSAESAPDPKSVLCQFYDHGRDTKGNPCSLTLLLRYIGRGASELARSNKTLRQAVQDIRRTVEDLQSQGVSVEIIKKAVADEKSSLPSVCFSGRFILRDARALYHHTQLVCVDLDHLKPERIKELKAGFATDPHVLLAFLSPTGTGLKVVFRVSGLEKWMGSEEVSQEKYAAVANQFHLAAFRALETYVLEKYQERIDVSCKDVSRMCYLSHDPDLILNENAIPLPMLPPAAAGSEPNPDPSPRPVDGSPSANNSDPAAAHQATEGANAGPAEDPIAPDQEGSQQGGTSDGTQSASGTERSADQLRQMLAVIPADARSDWLRVLAALKDWGAKTGQGQIAFQLADEWSRKSKKYDEADQRRTWDSLTGRVGRNNATVGTIIFLARLHGWSRPIKPSEWMKEKFPRLAEKYGEPFEEAMAGKGEGEKRLMVKSLCESFLAATLGEAGSVRGPVVFSPQHNGFFQYEPAEGIYKETQAPVLIERIAGLLRECARNCEHRLVNTKSLEFGLGNTKKSAPVVARAEGVLAVPDSFWEVPARVIPCKNGVLDFRNGGFGPFTPDFHFLSKLGVTYRAGATCPRWLAILSRSLPADDIELLQRWFSLLLLGHNRAQIMLMLIGNAQSGKGVIGRVAAALAGTEAVGTLRTSHLAGRFEIGRLRNKRLIYGPDVAANFLSEEGVNLVKAITGEDHLDAEFKGSNATPPAKPLHAQVLITANSRLRIRLEEDAEAWRRRLVVIKFEAASVTVEEQVIGLTEILIAEEGDGILNWALEGLKATDAAGGKLILNARQQGIRNDLLSESESYKLWARERVIRSPVGGPTGRLMVEEAFADYIAFCDEREWAPLTRKVFTRLVTDVIAREFHVCMRNDLRTSFDTYGRGWKGITIKGGDSELSFE